MKRRHVILAPTLLLAGKAGAAPIEVERHGGRFTVEFGEGMRQPLQSLMLPWIEKSADAVAMYYGKFPVPETYIHLPLTDGAGIGGGQTFPGDVPLIRIRVGANSTEDQLMHDDWVMVHEMIHLAFPWLNRRHNWMAEGIAVYVESIARVQAGHVPQKQIWNDFIAAMPKGLPKQGEGGLDQTPSWGRTYWGGAMFCLICDIRLRQRTDNKFGLQHALRGINEVRDFRREWPFRETLEIGDKATGSTVLVDTYDEMRETAVSPDLGAIWRELGVDRGSDGIVFDDKAELAAIRMAITTPVT